MKFLKAHWGAVMSVAGTLITFLIPSIQGYASQHPTTALGVILGALLTMYYSQSPVQKQVIAALLEELNRRMDQTELKPVATVRYGKPDPSKMGLGDK